MSRILLRVQIQHPTKLLDYQYLNIRYKTIILFSGYQSPPRKPTTGKAKSSGLYYKSFAIVIYDHNDSGQYYKTMIMLGIYNHS